jgi:hypothetical protein
MLVATGFLLMAALAPAKGSPGGLYRVQQMEMAGGLELKSNGRFRYALDYGAASERAEGNWTFDGKVVRLTSNPMPKLPRFELVRDDPAPRGQLWMTVEKKGFNWGGRVDALATTTSGERGRVTPDETGRITVPNNVGIAVIEPLVPVYGTPGGAVKLSADRGHRLLFRFHANDAGKAAFKAEPLALNGSDLVFDRFDTTIRFVRSRP